MATTALPVLRPHGPNKVGELLRLIARLRTIDDVISPEGLRQAIELALEFAALLGMESEFIDRLRVILADESVFQTVLAIVRFLGGLIDVVGEPAQGAIRLSSVDGGTQSDVTIQGFLEWLPTVLQILELIRQLSETFESNT